MHETQRCLFCNQQKNAGINILMFFICLDCEREIVATSPFDLKYLVFLEKIKKLWKEPDFIEYQQENPSGKNRPGACSPVLSSEKIP
ncbi:MAG: sigma factor G inhibitor Gin [Dethiobacteria bacterium]